MTDRSSAQREHLREIAARIVDQAQPGEQIEAYVVMGSSVSVKAYEGEVESFTSATSSGIGVRVVADQRQGFAHAGSLDPEVALEALAEARDNRAFAQPDEFLGLAEPDGVPPVEVDLWNPSVLAFSTDQKIELAIRLEQAVKAYDPRVVGVRVASYGDATGEGVVLTSSGIDVYGRGTSCHLAVSALARDGDETTIGGASDVGRAPEALDFDDVVERAAERAVRLLGATKPASTRLPVVFDPRTASTFLSIVSGMLNGERILKGRSPFSDRLGEAIAAPGFSLVDDPTDPRSLGADSHDGEGLACRRNVLIDSGCLALFLQNSYTGRRNGTGSTGSAARGYYSTPGVGAGALSLVPGTRSTEEIIAGLDRGILVQSLSGVHSGVNAVSGDFSVGAEGLMIRDGELAEPVKEATIASSIQRMLLGIVDIGSELEWLPSGTGSAHLVIDDMSLSGT